MKKSLMIVMAMLLGITSVWSRPATRGVAQITQPDGSTLSIRLKGDEWRHYNTTADGYALTRDTRGYYVYAQLDDNGQLAPTTLVAHDEERRSAAEHLALPVVSTRLRAARSGRRQPRRRRLRASPKCAAGCAGPISQEPASTSAKPLSILADPDIPPSPPEPS